MQVFLHRLPCPRDPHRHLNALRGTGPRATGTGAAFFFRCLARDRPSRYGSVAESLARDRPSPYGCRCVFFRSAGACPPRSLALREGRSTYPIVARGPVPRDRHRHLNTLRGTGPRATVEWRRALRGTGPRATGAGAAFFFVALRGTGPRATGAGGRFFVVRGLVPRNRPQNPKNPPNLFLI